MEKGELTIDCQKCGAEMFECIQTKRHNKERKTEAVVYECSERHRCGAVVVVTKKTVNIKQARRKTNAQLSDWPDIKPKDLRF